jgi:hypothetical protein
MLLCRECNTERDEIYFRKTRGKYFFTKRCKFCLGIKNVNSRGKYKKSDPGTLVELKLKKRHNLSLECLKFLNDVKMSKGYIDMVGAYKLAHYFTEVFGYIEFEEKTIEEELVFMLETLLDVKKKTIK